MLNSTLWQNIAEISEKEKFENNKPHLRLLREPFMIFKNWQKVECHIPSRISDIIGDIYFLGQIESIFSGIDKRCTVNWEFYEIRINTSLQQIKSYFQWTK